MSAQVLVVETDPESRALLSRVMGEAGFSVETAEDSSDARVRSAERPPDLVLLDLELPGESAWPLLGELRGGERAPMVVGIGGAAALQTLLRGVHGGVAGFVGRPVHLGDLLRTCLRVVDSSRATEAEGAERRAAARHPLQVPLHVLSESGRAVAVAELVDLSATGARFLLLAPFEIGSRVRLSLEPQLAGEGLTLVGEVRWRAPTGSGWAHGIEFAGLDDAVRDRLAELVSGDEPGTA